jgi:hypothetical protein
MAAIMETPNDEVARLDMAARAIIGNRFISHTRWSFLVMTVFLVALAVASGGSFHETYLLPGIAVCAALLTLILWVSGRYKLYVPAVFFFILAIQFLLSGKTIVRVSDRIYGSIMSAMLGYVFWRHAGPFATVNVPGWEKERAKVDAWWRALTAPERNEQVIEFSTGSFWTGYYRYRIMRPGPHWAVAKLWKGKVSARSDYRVRDLSEVTFATMPKGETKVSIGNRTMQAVNVSPPMLGSADDSSLSKSA